MREVGQDKTETEESPSLTLKQSRTRGLGLSLNSSPEVTPSRPVLETFIAINSPAGNELQVTDFRHKGDISSKTSLIGAESDVVLGTADGRDGGVVDQVRLVVDRDVSHVDGYLGEVRQALVGDERVDDIGVDLAGAAEIATRFGVALISC